MALVKYIKDPTAVLDYSFDWSLWLQPSEVISSSSWTVQQGLVPKTTSHDDTVAVVWLRGGEAGKQYLVTNTIVTNQNRTDSRSIVVVVAIR